MENALLSYTKEGKGGTFVWKGYAVLLLGQLVGWLVGFLTSSSTTRLYRGRAPRQERLTILRGATHETELGDHGFCFSRSHYTDTDPTSRERAATAGIEPGSSSPGVARSTAELPRPPSGTEMALS